MKGNLTAKGAKGAKEIRKGEEGIVDMDIEDTARMIVDAAVMVHRALGPGLLESVYQTCLAHELKSRGLKVECEVLQPIHYKDERIDAGYRLDMLVDGQVIIENKTVENILPIHQAQLLTYLKLHDCRLGFLINWNVILIRDGIKRMVNHI